MRLSLPWSTDVTRMKHSKNGTFIHMSEEQKQQLIAIRLQDGTTALDYVLSWPEAEREWSIAGVLSCIEKGYSLNHLTINWEARDILYEQQKTRR